MDPDNLTFTDIIILGMDKEPTNFVLNDTAISNVSYNASTKVGNCSILQGPCWKLTALRFWQPALSHSIEFGGAQRHWHARKSTTPWGEGRIQTEKHVLTKHESLNFVPVGPWKKAVLWANLKLDILIPHVMQFHTLLFKLYYLIHWPRSGRYLHIHPLIELKILFATQLIFSLVF